MILSSPTNKKKCKEKGIFFLTGSDLARLMVGSFYFLFLFSWVKMACEDNQAVGNIVAHSSFTQGGMSRYRITKSFIERYNGAEVIVKLPKIALGTFKSLASHGA
jgi:hypothetical protein